MSEEAPDAAEVRLNRLLNLILETAVEALGFSAATVSVRHGKDVSTVGATDQRLLAVDDAQYQDGGPCMATLDQADPMFLRDVETDSDEAWEHFATTAAHLGVKSSLSMHIPTDTTDVAASLNLYSRPPVMTYRRVGYAPRAGRLQPHDPGWLSEMTFRARQARARSRNGAGEQRFSHGAEAVGGAVECAG